MSDAGQREPRRSDTPRLPNIVTLTVTRVPFEPPQLRNFESSLSRYDRAIEFRIRTDQPMPSTNLPLLLYVGDTTLTEMRPIGDLEYVYYAFDDARLAPGAPITLAFPNTPREARGRAAYRYQGPEGS